MLCRLRLLYAAGQYAILARCTYCAALPIFQGVVHRALTTFLARCTYCAPPGLGVMYVNTQHCEIDYSLFCSIFYISKKANKQSRN
jgi:hypothetical protein